MLPTKIRYIWPNGFRGEEFKKSPNQKQESPVAAMFISCESFLKMWLIAFFSSPCQRQCELLPSLGVRRLLNFHILIFPSFG
jgi:hypothetical protein